MRDMRLIVCYKMVPDEQDIVVNSDKTLSFNRAEWTIGQYDLNAVEAGAKLAEQLGGEVFALTVGGPEVENSKMKKSILSRGMAQNFTVNDPALIHADSLATAKALAAAAEKIGDWDLILCGEGSSDQYSQQVGIQLGELLKVPTVNGVSAISTFEGGLIAERSLEDEVEILNIELPAVLSVIADMNVTRVPSMKEIMGAGKKPSTHWTNADVLVPNKYGVTTLSVLAPSQTERKCMVLEGDDKTEEFVKLLRAQLQ